MMDISSMAGVAATTNTLAGSKSANDAGTAALNQTLSTQAQQSAEQTEGSTEATESSESTRGLPEHIGRNINVTA